MHSPLERIVLESQLGLTSPITASWLVNRGSSSVSPFLPFTTAVFLYLCPFSSLKSTSILQGAPCTSPRMFFCKSHEITPVKGLRCPEVGVGAWSAKRTISQSVLLGTIVPRFASYTITQQLKRVSSVCSANLQSFQVLPVTSTISGPRVILPVYSCVHDAYCRRVFLGIDQRHQSIDIVLSLVKSTTAKESNKHRHGQWLRNDKDCSRGTTRFQANIQ